MKNLFGALWGLFAVPALLPIHLCLELSEDMLQEYCEVFEPLMLEECFALMGRGALESNEVAVPHRCVTGPATQVGLCYPGGVRQGEEGWGGWGGGRGLVLCCQFESVFNNPIIGDYNDPSNLQFPTTLDPNNHQHGRSPCDLSSNSEHIREWCSTAYRSGFRVAGSKT